MGGWVDKWVGPDDRMDKARQVRAETGTHRRELEEREGGERVGAVRYGVLLLLGAALRLALALLGHRAARPHLLLVVVAPDWVGGRVDA